MLFTIGLSHRPIQWKEQKFFFRKLLQNLSLVWCCMLDLHISTDCFFLKTKIYFRRKMHKYWNRSKIFCANWAWNLVEISIFSINHVIIRLTKIINNLVKHLKIRRYNFQSHFSVLKIDQIFLKKKFYEEYLTRRQTFIKKCFWKFWFLRYFIF